MKGLKKYKPRAVNSNPRTCATPNIEHNKKSLTEKINEVYTPEIVKQEEEQVDKLKKLQSRAIPPKKINKLPFQDR
jgi:hypothetical protein